MVSIVNKLAKAGIAKPPSFVPGGCQYETIMGSEAYGVSTDTSDKDIYGFCMPPKNVVFPHLYGHINGFGPTPDRFDQYQQHHLEMNGKVYDLNIYNIVKYFQLCMDNNPNMVDSLFTPQECVVHCTQIGQMVREKRELFLHKGAWVKFQGYARSQLAKMSTKVPIGKRKESYEKYGFDLKYAYHLVRLTYSAHQILQEGTLDIRRHREHLKSIRRGEISEKDIRSWFESQDKIGNKIVQESTLRKKPAVDEIKALLLECLEHFYGNLENAYVKEDIIEQSMREIVKIVKKVECKL